MKRFIFILCVMIFSAVRAQLSLGYNAGVFNNKLQFFEILNHEYGLQSQGEKFMYNRPLHGVNIGFPLFQDKSRDNIMMEYQFSVKATKSNAVVLDTTSVLLDQYKIRLATHSLFFSRPFKQWKVGAGMDFSIIKIKRRKIEEGENPIDFIFGQKMFNNSFTFGATFFVSYRPKKMKYLEIRPYYNWHAIKEMELIREEMLPMPVSFKFSNIGINVNLLISKKKK